MLLRKSVRKEINSQKIFIYFLLILIQNLIQTQIVTLKLNQNLFTVYSYSTKTNIEKLLKDKEVAPMSLNCAPEF